MKNKILTLVSLIVGGGLLHGQNVGIGTTTPTRARLEVHGAVDATSAIFGGESTGISLQRNWPGVGYNQYYNGGHRRLAAGFSALQALDPTNGNLYFDMGVNGTGGSLITGKRALTIENSGNVHMGSGTSKIGINTDSPAYTLEIRQSKDTAGFERGILLVSPERNFDNWELVVTRSIGVDRSYLYFNANNYNTVQIDPTNGNYNTYSDARLKTKIHNVPAVLHKVMQLRPVGYEMIDTPTATPAQQSENVGFLAQEVKTLFPHLVNVTEGKIKSTDTVTDLHTMNYSGFGVIAIKAIQEQQRQIEELKARVDKLEQLLTNKR